MFAIIILRGRSRTGIIRAGDKLAMMLAASAEAAENKITGFTVEKLLIDVLRTFRDNLPPLTSHQVKQLIDQKRWRKTGHATAWELNHFATYWTSKRSASIERILNARSGRYPDQADSAECVRAGQQLRRVLITVIGVQARATGEKALGEVFVIQ